MTLPPLTYLSMDSIVGGVGASQVLPYVERLVARGLDITLHSFEPESAPTPLVDRISAAGIRWVGHPFGAPGSRGGVARLCRATLAVRGAELLHARSDVAAGAALLARPAAWVWDVRSFWADQRIALGMLRSGSPEERMLRRIERGSARRSDAIITLTRSAVDVLESRHGADVRSKATVITTCVDLDLFVAAPLPAPEPLRFLLSGSLNTYYDVPLMLALVERSAARRATTLTVLTPGSTPWDVELAEARAIRHHARPAEVPDHVARSHVGLVVCRDNAGVSLAAAMPTKLGEFLACGRPVVVNQGLGDAAELVRQHGCGVVVGGSSPDHLAVALDELDALLTDPALPTRCRAVAEESFNLDHAVEQLTKVYERAAS